MNPKDPVAGATTLHKKYNYKQVTFTFEGRRYKVYGKTKSEADRKAGEKLAQLKRGEVGISGNMRVSSWCKTYLDTYIKPRVVPPGTKNRPRGTLTEKSSKMYYEKINGYLVPEIGGLRLNEVTTTHLQRIVNEQAGKSFSHVSKLIAVIKMVFRQAHVERLITYDPSYALQRPAVEKKTRRALTPEELSVWHAVAATHKHGLWAEFHLAFGVRPAEVPPLRVMDLDFERHRLNVSQALESGTHAVKDPKTAAGIRRIPIPPDFEPKLKEYVAGRHPTDFLFPNESGGMISESVIRRRWRSFKRAMDLYMGAQTNAWGKIIPETSKIAPDLTLYCTRHTYCTELGAKGIDASQGRFVTGHADVSTLANIYMHSNDQVVQSVADRLYHSQDRGHDTDPG